MIYIATDNYNDGFPLSNAYDDVIYQKANAEYYLKFRFPVDRLGIWKHLTCETILKADDTRGLQLFKIKKINKINGYVRVYAKHITDDLNFIGVDNLAVSNATGRRVMEALAGSTTEQHNFIFNSDIATMHTLNLSNTTAGKVLSKDKHSILGQWGGELIRDNFLVDLKARAGVDTEILFMNKKNVKNLDNAISTENITTRLKLSVEVEGEGNNKQTITATVDSPNINAYPRVYTNYLKVNSKTITSQEQLIEYGKKYFRDTLVDFPSDNLTVNVIDRNQERVNLFDTVWFRNVEFDIDKRLKVVAYEFSPMSKRYKKISFGALKVANFGQIKSLSQLEEKIDEKITESFTDAFKIQKNLSELLKLDRKAIEDKMLELEEKSKGAVEVKRALFEADGTIPDVVKTKILDAVEGDIGRLKTIITEAELIKAIQAKLNFAEIKNALIDKAFINQIISDERFTQQFEDGQVTTQNIFTKLKDSIKSNILKEVITKDGVKKIVNDLTVDADGIRQITQEEITNRREELKGKSSYIHTRYSDNANGSNFDTNSNRKYIGVYAGEKEQAPTNASEYSWTKLKSDGRLYKAYANSLNGLDFTLVEPEENAKLFAKNKPRVNIVNDNDISDIWQANMFLSFKPNTKYTLTARAKGNNNKLWAYFRNNKTNAQYNWGQLEFRGLETKSITFTTTNDVDDVLFKFVLVPEDEDWTGVQIDWFTIYEGDKRYSDYPVDEPAQYHKYRYFGYVFKEGQPIASDFDWFDLQQTSITNDKYTHIVYSDYSDGTSFGRDPKKYMGVARTTSPTQPANKMAYKWFKVTGEDGRDGVDGKSINENLLPNSNFAKDLEGWEMARLNNSGLNWQKGHAIDNFGRGLHIWGTPNGEYKGLGTVPFSLIAKQGEKLTLSMDLGKDALTQNAILYIGLHYVVNNDIVSQQWQTLDLATQNFEVKKYKRISKTFTVSADMNKCRLMIHTQNNKLINFYIDNIKLERGDTATDWSPAYEDLRGRDGVSNYIHRKYSDSSNGANMSDNSNLKYIGIYTGTSPTPPTTASSYLWSKIKGEDGANGTPGVKGADGRTPYFHTAYANSPTGDRDFSTTNSSNKLYIGTYSDFEVADSTDYRRYKWVKIKGENGRDGVSSYIYRKYSDNANGSPMSDNSNLKYIGIYTGTSATAPTTPSAYTWSKIKGEDGAQGVPGARGSDGRTSYLHTAYSNSATGDRDFSTTNSTNKEYIGTYTDFEINDSNDYRRYKWVKIKGENGRDGRNGVDGKSINENLVPNSNFAKELENWEMSRLINSGLNYQKGHAIQNFGRGYHFWGTPNGESKGLGSMFNFIAKQGEKITLSMDLGKDALNNYSTLLLGVHYIGEDNTIKAQEWQQLDLATIGLELKKYKRISKTFTVGSDMRKCRLMIHCKPQQLANFYIDNIKLERGEVATEWSPAYEDLQGHTLTANVRFEGTYINNVTNNLRVFLDVYYDGRKVPSGFNAQVKYKGGNRSDWSNFWNANVDSTGRITNIDWGNREQNGEPLDVIVLVTYKDKDAIASARTDNTPNIGELKETIQRYKRFESTLSEFRSEIGYVKETTQILGDTVPDLSKDKRTTTGNDVYFYPSVPLKPNTPYTIVADTSGLREKQETGIYNASGNTKKPIMNNTNFWVVKFPTQQDRVNFYPLGTNTTISNVRIYEGDFTETLQGNLYVTHTIHPSVNKWLVITLNKKLEYKDLVLYFDVDGDVSNKSFWYNNALSNFSGNSDVEFPLKNKDNVVSVSSFGNSIITLVFNYANPTIKNVRVYEVNYAFRKLTQTQTQNIGTVFKQSAEDIIVAWNNYNKYFSFNNETLDILEKDSYQNKYKKISLTSEGLKIYNNNTLIGTIGTFTHLGQSFRQNTFDIVLTDDTKAFGVYTWQDFSAFGSRTTGYAPLFEIKKDEGGTYRSYFHQPLQVRTAYIDRLSVAETGTSYVGGVTKTINVGGRYLKFVQGILVSG